MRSGVVMSTRSNRNSVNLTRDPSGRCHLIEAFALCESILARYDKSNMTLDEGEIKAFYKLHSRVEVLLSRNAHAANGVVRHNDHYEVSKSGNGSNNEAQTSSSSHSDLHGDILLDRSSNASAALQQSAHAIVNMQNTVRIVESCISATASTRQIMHTLTHELGNVMHCSVRVYYTNHNDKMLNDVINGVAAAMDDTTAIGKSINMTVPYTIAGTLYIPLIIDGVFVGCIEAPGGVYGRANAGALNTTMRVAAVVLRYIIQKETTSWEAQKSDAMLTMATRLARDTLDERTLIQSIMNTAKTLTESDRCSMFLVMNDNSLEAHFEDGNIVNMPEGAGIAGYVARTGNVVNISNAYEDERFNRQVDKATGYHTKTILCLPVMYEGAVVAVAQLINKLDVVTESGLRLPRTFGKRDEVLFHTFSMFAAASLRNCRINDNLMNEKKKSDAILDVVTLLSNTDIRDVDSIVRHVLHGAKRLLGADRSSLFLLDKERNELYSRMADSVGESEIRFASGKGIAGTVAASGIGENIVDAYKDSRFNSAVDKKLGYVTQSILCEPIILNGEVLAVVQLVNKLDKHGNVKAFSEQDRETFRVFSLFAGISINNSHLLQFAINAGREAMELNELRSNFTARARSMSMKTKFVSISEAERRAVLSIDFRGMYDFTSTSFDLFQIREKCENPLDASAAVVYQLLLSTGLPQKFGCRETTLLNFILQCRKKYRFVPYHNFYHVVDVCQTLHTYLYAGNAKEFLTELECYVLLVTALVHDLDHMGVNNSFYVKTDSPLGILSSASGNTSVLEVHHCNLAIEILSDPDADVFEGLADEQVRYAYRALIDCVLATDMAKHAAALESFLTLVAAGYKRDEEDARRRVMEMLVKAGDVSNVTKPFETSRLWAMAVTEEFYRQGDMEKEKGVEVLPMFDRSRNNELAKGQIGFIDFVAGKFFKEIVSHFFHGMQWCVDNINYNRAQWQAMLDEKQK